MNSSTDSSRESTHKPARRAALRAQRRDMWAHAGERASADLALQQQALEVVSKGGFRCLFIYLAAGDEAPTTYLVEQCAKRSQVCIPHLTGEGAMNAVIFPGWSGLEVGPFGVQTSREPCPCPDDIDAVVVPGLGFTRAGGRLGYGKGFYERWLALHPGAYRIGLCYEKQIVGDLPMEAHDERLDAIVCESGVTFTGARQSVFKDGEPK